MPAVRVRLQQCRPLESDPAAGELRLRNPRLPKFLREVTVRDLHVGDGSVDFTVRRDGDGVSVSVLRTTGMIEVAVRSS